MLTINEIIKEVDRKIRVERMYLHKKHQNGIFDFQLSGVEFEPYEVSHEKYIYPLIEKMINNTNNSIDIIQDVYLLNDIESYKLPQDYFNSGILAKTLLLDKEGLFVLTQYYRNITPQNYTFKLELPIDEEMHLKVLNRLAYSNRELSSNILQMSIHLPEPLHHEMKRLNPGMRFNSKTQFVLEKEDIDLTWTQINHSIKVLVERLDDTCVNIFNRVDHINFLTNNVEEIKYVIDNISNEDRQQFKKYYKDNKDWFNLIVEAIDLTQNKFYKTYVDPAKIKIQAERINEVLHYIALNVLVDNAPKENIKKNKI